MGHHIDTRYAFNDRLLFPDEATFQRIDMYHSDVDNATAAKKAMEYLQNSMYKDQLPNAGLYYEQLADRGQGAEGAEHAQAGRLAAEGRRHAVDGATWSTWRPSSTGTTWRRRPPCRWEAG